MKYTQIFEKKNIFTDNIFSRIFRSHIRYIILCNICIFLCYKHIIYKYGKLTVLEKLILVNIFLKFNERAATTNRH